MSASTGNPTMIELFHGLNFTRVLTKSFKLRKDQFIIDFYFKALCPSNLALNVRIRGPLLDCVTKCKGTGGVPSSATIFNVNFHSEIIVLHNFVLIIKKIWFIQTLSISSSPTIGLVGKVGHVR